MPDYVVKIIKDKDKLQQRCDEINLFNQEEFKSVYAHIQTVKDALRTNKDLICLAAPQLGFKERFFCIKFDRGDIRAFINPLIITSKNLHLSREFQIGVDNKEYIIPRYEEIRVEYQTPIGTIEDNTFKGAASQVFQQMNDLIEGITLDTLGLEVLDGYDEANEETKKLIIEMWMNSLKEKENQLKEEIKNDEELGQINGAISFLKEVELGNVKLEKLTESEIESVVANTTDKDKQSENKTDENI